MIRRATLLAVMLAFAMRPAAADGSRKLAALAIATEDARSSIAIGPGGELYEPDGHGAWQRKRGGGIGPEILSVARTPTQTIAGTAAGAFRLGTNGWSVIYLGQKAKPVVASGTRAVAAVGRQLFVLDQGPAATGHEPPATAVAPSPIIAIGASAQGIVVATASGVFRLEGKALVPVPRVGAVTSFAGDRYALIVGGAVDLKTGATIRWPAGVTIDRAIQLDDALVAAASLPTGIELVRVRNGTIDRDKTNITGTPIGAALDRDGRAVIALDDGRLLTRDKGATTWSSSTITDALPPARPGSPPALSH